MNIIHKSIALKANNVQLYYCLLDFKDKNPHIVRDVCKGEEKALSQMNTEQITKLLKRMINQVLHSK